MTIHRRVLLASMATASASMVVSGILVWFLVRASLVGEFDSNLVARAQVLAGLVEVDERAGGYEFHAPEALPKEVAFRVRSPTGVLIASAGDVSLLGVFAQGEAVRLERPRCLHMADGRRVRAVSTRGLVKSEDGHLDTPLQSVTVDVVQDTRLVDRDLRNLAMVVVGVGIGIGIISGLTLSAVLRAALRPLGHVAAEIAALDAGALDHRLSVTHAPGELQPIVHRLNELLARVEHDFQREKCFNAAIAHELRTPLGGLQSTLEVHLASDGQAPEFRKALETCHGICMDMNRLVERLLLLAKADAGQIHASRIETDVAHLVMDCWTAARARAEARSMRLQPVTTGPLMVTTDPALMHIVVTNLIDNALSHGVAGSTVRIFMDATPSQFVFRIGNQAYGLDGDQERVFDRFWRADHARTNTGEHYGLGMSLCRDLVHVLGGRITARGEGGWFTVEFVLTQTRAVPVETVPQ